MPTVKGCHGGWRDLCPYACTCGGHVPPSCCPARDGRNRARGPRSGWFRGPFFRAPRVWPCARPCACPALSGSGSMGVAWVGPLHRFSGLGDTAASFPAGGGPGREDRTRFPARPAGQAGRTRAAPPPERVGRERSATVRDGCGSPVEGPVPPLLPMPPEAPVRPVALPSDRPSRTRSSRVRSCRADGAAGGRERAGRAPRGHPSGGAFPPVGAVKWSGWAGSWGRPGGRVKSPAPVVRGRGRASRGARRGVAFAGVRAVGAGPAPGWCGRARTGGRVRLRRGVSRSPVCGGRRGLGVPVSNPRTPRPCGRSGWLPGSGTGTRSGSAPGGGSGRGRRPPGGSGTVIDRAPVHRVCDCPGRPEHPAPDGRSGPVRSVPSSSVCRRFGAV